MREREILSHDFFSHAMGPSLDIRAMIIGESNGSGSDENNFYGVLDEDVFKVEDVDNEQLNVVEIIVRHWMEEHIEDNTLCTPNVNPIVVERSVVRHVGNDFIDDDDEQLTSAVQSCLKGYDCDTLQRYFVLDFNDQALNRFVKHQMLTSFKEFKGDYHKHFKNRKVSIVGFSVTSEAELEASSTNGPDHAQYCPHTTQITVFDSDRQQNSTVLALSVATPNLQLPLPLDLQLCRIPSAKLIRRP
ncbi:CACTA en-spm transposon protein [Cucumis melo var. makuwa]|uniref:CACTA en-spm transposon protein n=1 Tax=Cucumis melo var. makuwa TaxID=1194695 RepID=A0A5A7VAD2_CUCMM|nr:CACTA en-spm transposon protein [Cucumis melo var. makuwa]